MRGYNASPPGSCLANLYFLNLRVRHNRFIQFAQFPRPSALGITGTPIEIAIPALPQHHGFPTLAYWSVPVHSVSGGPVVVVLCSCVTVEFSLQLSVELIRLLDVVASYIQHQASFYHIPVGVLVYSLVDLKLVELVIDSHISFELAKVSLYAIMHMMESLLWQALCFITERDLYTGLLSQQ